MLRIFFALLAIFGFTSFTTAQEPVKLTLAGYTVPREAYAEIIPLFQEYWLETTGQEVIFEESYLGSGAQSRAVEGGFEADVVALSLENDVTRLVDAGLIMSDWKDNPYGGMVSTSLAVLIVRPDNPKNITDWHDLTREDVEVLTPNPETSGGAQWNVLAAYGAAFRGYVDGYEASEEGALQFLVDVFANVSVLDASARESFITFENGIGDVAISYENEYFAAIRAGGDYEVIYPSSTILIENPVAIVDEYVDAHGNREVAEAFVEFLYRPESQSIFAEHGLRPPVLKSTPESEPEATPEATLWTEEELDPDVFPLVEDIFTVEIFGGWDQIGIDFFSPEGLYTQVITQGQ